MGVVSTDFLAGLLTGFRTLFETEYAFAHDAQDWLGLVMELESVSDKEGYNWFGAVPAMSEWRDQRKLYGLRPEEYEIKNLNYESSIQVDRNTLEDDKYGMIKPRIQQLSQRAASHPGKLIFQLLDAGHETNTYDGNTFFHDTRQIGDSGVIDNILAGAYSASTTEILTGIAAGIVLMRNFCDDRGEPMNLFPDTLVCSPVMEIPIRAALIPAIAGTVRPEAELIKRVVVSPYLKEGTGKDYYLVSTATTLRALLLQVRKKPELVAVDSPTSVQVFMNRMLLYGVDARWGVALLEPRCCVKVDCN